MINRVREPIQVYLSEEERAELDRTAGEMGVSRSEALRRGISALARAPAGASSHAGGPDILRRPDLERTLTPRLSGPGEAPPRAPVAPLGDLMAELAGDRQER